MHLGLTRTTCDPERRNEVLRVVAEFRDVLQSQPGFLGYTACVDDTELPAITRRDSAEAANVPRDAPGVADIVAWFSALGVQLQPPQVYEVVQDE